MYDPGVACNMFKGSDELVLKWLKSGDCSFK